MKTLKKLALYTPEDDERVKMGALFLKSAGGVDWYEAQRLYGENTLKIAYDENGVVRSIAQDISMMWPVGLSVSEIDAASAPEGIAIDGSWLFDGKRVTQKAVDYVVQAEKVKAEKLAEAESRIAMLSRATRLKMATEAEAAELEALERYTVYLERLDTSTAPNIMWPEVAGDVA